MLPMTKVGADSKKRAYVLTRKKVKAIALAALAALAIAAMLILKANLDVNAQRRKTVQTTLELREAEHAAHLRVVKLSTLLQKRLEDEVDDMDLLATFRSRLWRSIGDYQAAVAAAVANCSDAKAAVEALDRRLFDEVTNTTHSIWADAIAEGKAAKRHMHNLTSTILRELRDEDSEAGEFERVMREQGEFVARQPHDGRHAARDSRSALGHALSLFHDKLKEQGGISYKVDNETLTQWEELLENMEGVLGDENMVADLKRMHEKMATLIAERGAPPYDPKSGLTEVDYFAELIERARLEPHREGLLALLQRWRSGDAPISSPLERVEELIDDGALPADALSADDYAYDEGYGDEDDGYE